MMPGVLIPEQDVWLNAIIHVSPIPQFVIDSNHRVIHWNEALEKYSGIKAEEIIGTKQQWRAFYSCEHPCMADLIAEDTIEKNPEWYEGKYAKSSLVEGSYEATDFFPHMGGSGRWLYLTAAPIRNAEGRIIGAVETLEDITKHKKVEEALRKSEEKYRTLFEDSFDGLFITSPAGKILDMNKKGILLFGYNTKEEILNLDLERDVYANPLDRKRILAMVNAQGTAEYEVVVKKKSGEMIVTYCSLTAVKDKTGSITSYRGIIRDITDKKRAEEALKKSERNYRTLAEAAPDPIFIIGRDDTVLFINTRAAQVLNLSIEHILNQPRKGLFPPDVADEQGRDLQTVFNTGKPLRKEAKIRYGDREYWQDNSLVPLTDENDEVYAVLGISHDITGRKRTEDALRESEEQFRLLYENASEGIIIAESETRKFVRANPAICSMLGYTEAELRSMTIADIHRREDLDYMLEKFRALVMGEITQADNLPFLCRDGTIRILNVASSRVTLHGKMYIIGLFSDVTERMRAEEALQKSRAQYRELVENISDVILTLDLNGTVTYISPVVQRLFGYTVTEVIGQHFTRFVHPDDIPYATEGFRLRLTGVYNANEFRVLTKDNRERYVRTSQTPVMKEGVITGFNYTLSDVTERRMAEETLKDFNKKLQQGIEKKTTILRENELRHLRLFESSHDAIMTLEPPDWRFTSGNPATVAMFRTQDEAGFTSKAPWELSPEFQPDGRPSIEKAREMIEKAVVEGSNFFEWTHRRITGETFPATVLLTRFEWKGMEILQATVRDITEQKHAEEIIRASLDEKSLLLREIHHRVKNNLQIIISLVNLQMRQIDDERLKQVMAETQNRVRAMAFVHEKLYQSEDIAHIDIASYTRFLVTHLFSFYGVDSRQVVLNMDIGKIMSSINTAIPLGLIINELASNALKHAFPEGRTGTLSITIRQVEKTLSLSVMDDGIGVPGDFDWRNAETLGLRLVISLVDQLDGTIELDRCSGTAFTIVIKEKD
ncbi:PAS domain S-box protein [Methanoregula sp.]|uniref:PAS domain S-box protein n=1 Tax=Methanoregula sp. TaxID=2052170 RepID=UPI0035656133